jgi:class 3 adenylate cyclase
VRTRNLAVMFTDIKGFTEKTSRQTRQENALMLARHDALLLPVLRAFGGRRIKNIGDALLVIFDSPTGSVLSGMAMQDRLWDYNRRVSAEERIDVRVAINLGEVRLVWGLRGGDIFGEPVNIASRVEGEARAGEVWFTEAVYLAMNKKEAPAEEVGLRELKGIPEPVRLYRVPSHGTGNGEPPYGNAALSLVTGLAPPEPQSLMAEPRPLWRAIPANLAGGARSLLGGMPAGLVRTAAVGVGFLAAIGVTAWMMARGTPTGLIESGRFEEAEAAIAEVERERGKGDGEVLFLKALLAGERNERGLSTSTAEVFERYRRALAAGNMKALGWLEQKARHDKIEVRCEAAQALVRSGRAEAAPALRRLAEDDPPKAKEKGGGGFFADVGKALSDAVSGECRPGEIARLGLQKLEKK